MSRLWMPALVCACVLTLTALPAPADETKPPAAMKGDAVAAILTTLENEMQIKEGSNINDIPLFELLQELAKKHNLTFIINEESFRAANMPNIKEDKPRLATTHLRGLTVHQFLSTTLGSIGAAYLIKNNAIEIVPIAHAARVTKSGTTQDEEGRYRLNEPLVSAVFKEKPLNEAVAKITEMYDLTIVVSPQAGEARTGPVSARMLNMPADKALELLALQADLRVIRRGAAFLITSKGHAIELFNEKLDRERQKIELEKFRESPLPKPGVPGK